MKNSKHIIIRSALVLGLTVLMVPFQNCSKEHFAGNQTQSQSQSADVSTAKGNGDSYLGKSQPYAFTDAQAPCTQLTSDGQPFPNREIFIIGGQFQLVRDNCQDIQPTSIDSSLITYVDDNTFVYMGQSFQVVQDFTKYDAVPAVCPSGRAVTDASPTNLSLDPLDLASDNWKNHPIPVSLFGSLSALPLFQITRDANSLPAWNRVSQNLSLKSNTDYAYNYVIKAGNVDYANFIYYAKAQGSTPAQDVEFSLNLIDGTVQQLASVTTLKNISAVSQRYGSGWSFTIFINTGNLVGQPDVGISTYSADGTIHVGDYVYATSAKEYEVSAYCSP